MTTIFSPIVIAGPCTAESRQLMFDVAEPLANLSKELGFEYVFKASFDKANRTSGQSSRGPGVEKALAWFADLKAALKVPVLTDVHESHQVSAVASVCDVLQIPAFLCRQTDLIVACAASGRDVNIKKGQFMAPAGMSHVVTKARHASAEAGKSPRLWLTERGASFGYGNLVVDMRGLAIMSRGGTPVLLDITHSTQLPAAGNGTSGAERQFAPLLARAAAATGYLSGFFLEVHSEPARAVSDADAQLTVHQASHLLRQIVPLLREGRRLAAELDHTFVS